jgi:DNA modification methylase
MLTKTKVFEQAEGTNWKLYLGDSCQVIQGLPDNSIDYGVSSPPFSNLYIYSDSQADMGNSSDDMEFFVHYEYLIKEMYRITKPGRLCSIHVKDLPAYQNRDGYSGLRDFPGDCIRAFERHGWRFHSRVTIWKDPVIEMQRTKNHGLLHKNFVKETNACRQGMADYVLTFRKWPIDEQEQVKQARVIGDYIGTKPPEESEYNRENGTRTPDEQYSIAVWQRYASPVWFDIDQTNVLNFRLARESDDEKHIAPLQLDLIERCIDLWTNKGDVVFDPFNGVGSTGVCAIKQDRRYIGIELKPGYFNHAIKFLKEAETAMNQPTLFDLVELEDKS